MQTTREDQGRTNEFNSALISLSQTHALLPVCMLDVFEKFVRCIYEIKIKNLKYDSQNIILNCKK